MERPMKSGEVEQKKMVRNLEEKQKNEEKKEGQEYTGKRERRYSSRKIHYVKLQEKQKDELEGA